MKTGSNRVSDPSPSNEVDDNPGRYSGGLVGKDLEVEGQDTEFREGHSGEMENLLDEDAFEVFIDLEWVFGCDIGHMSSGAGFLYHHCADVQ